MACKGTLVYKDRNYTFTEIPETLAGATHIRTFNDDKSHSKDDFVRFDINLLTLIWRSGRTTPQEARGGKNPMVIRISNGELFPIYRRIVEAGQWCLVAIK